MECAAEEIRLRFHERALPVQVIERYHQFLEGLRHTHQTRSQAVIAAAAYVAAAMVSGLAVAAEEESPWCSREDCIAEADSVPECYLEEAPASCSSNAVLWPGCVPLYWLLAQSLIAHLFVDTWSTVQSPDQPAMEQRSESFPNGTERRY